jgi:hypothetical protein
VCIWIDSDVFSLMYDVKGDQCYIIVSLMSCHG